MLTLLGLSSPDELANNISEQVGISMEEAQSITDDVVELIFNPIQEQLVNNIGEEKNIVDDVTVANKQSEKTVVSEQQGRQRDYSELQKIVQSPINPEAYIPKAKPKYKDDDPYLEPIE
jgi:hypothetical protein